MSRITARDQRAKPVEERIKFAEKGCKNLLYVIEILKNDLAEERARQAEQSQRVYRNAFAR